MKFAGQDKYGPMVIDELRVVGPHTARELANAIGADMDMATKAVHRMMRRGLVEATGEYRGVGRDKAQVYRYVDINWPDDEDQMISASVRYAALRSAEGLISSLRAGYNPAMFDPFRVLRAQVGGMA